ncbi:uncharacterized protein LOC131075912 [Cryptomeria japonica]|uniref:uncharacterized protein LOC131075912 n=1 Tax=Cryptomeria japonica TaxID=3369 RepID=UPI0027DA02F4|nr:uncharacterized protein LOC131075912 [Cryptomeria japonica]
MSILPSKALRSASLSENKPSTSSPNHGRGLGALHAQMDQNDVFQASHLPHEVAGSKPDQFAKEPSRGATAGASGLVNVVPAESQYVTRLPGINAKEFNTRSVNSRGKNGLDHSSRSQHSHSGALYTTLGMAGPSNGNLSDTVRPRNAEELNTGTSTLPITNVASRGRKGQMLNANHLLNFHYNRIPRTPRVPLRNQPPRRYHRIKPYDKDLFLQANFRFLVSDMGDYELNCSNPDKMLQWEDVAAVKYSAPAPVRCPICLESPPLCPQITTCGHIFCFPCILRYLMMGEEDHKGEHWKKCPFCSVMISCKDLYTVSINSVKQYTTGEIIEFTLLSRAKNSVIPFEKGQYSLGALPYSIDGDCNAFSKFTLTSDAELSTNRAADELTCWIEKVHSEGGEDAELLPYAYEAVDQLEQRKKAWIEHRASEYLSNSPPVKQQFMTQAKAQLCKLKVDSFDSRGEAESMETKSSNGIVSSDCESSKDLTGISESNLGQMLSQKGIAQEGEILESPATEELFPDTLDYWENQRSDSGSEKPQNIKNLEDKDACKHQQETTDSTNGESYSFYQAADGQLLVLHPLNMKCLLHHYGSYESLPPSICGKILEMETVTQTEGIRKRYRYLSHFPLTATFKLCEIDLSKILPASAFSPFSDEIEKRETERRHRQKQEARARHRAAAAVAAAPQGMSGIPESTVSICDDKPPSSADFEALGDPKGVSTSPPVFDERRLFSRVARLGFAAGCDPPALKDGLSGELPRDLSASGSNSINMETMGFSSESGTCSPSPMSFAHIITTAPKPSGDPCSQISKMQSSGKKGKRASKILLSTSGGRRY